MQHCRRPGLFPWRTRKWNPKPGELVLHLERHWVPAFAGMTKLLFDSGSIPIMGNIVWLASYPKSGNTWLRAFLANLIANRAEPLKPDELKNYADDEALPERFSELAGRPSHALDFGEIAALRPQVHALIAQRAKGTRLVKSHNMAGSVDGHPLYNWQVS